MSPDHSWRDRYPRFGRLVLILLWLAVFGGPLLAQPGCTPGEATVCITTPSPLPGATVGASYSQGVSVSGGAAPYQWAVTAGSLPVGLSLDSASCSAGGVNQVAGRRLRPLNSGVRVKHDLASLASNVCLIETPPGNVVPTKSATSTFTLTVYDEDDNTSSQQFTLPVNEPPQITTASLPNGAVGAAYSQTVAASGGTLPLLWAVSTGVLPAGLTLNSATGLISGTPTRAGPSSFTVQVTDANGATASQPLSIAINLVITNDSSLPIGFVGFPYVGVTFTAPGGVAPYAWSVFGGSLPAGLSLNTTTGQLLGTPTTTGTLRFTIEVVDSKGNIATATFALPVTTITANGPLTGEVGAPYNVSFTAIPPTPPPPGPGYYYWAVSETSGAPCSPSCLPPGLSLNSATGQITGTPTAAGTTRVALEVIFNYTSTPAPEFFYYAVERFTLTINPVLAITTTSPLPSADVGTNYNQTFTTTGGVPPLTWSVSAGSLPAGLSLNSATGQLTGIPTTPAPPITLPYTSNFTVQASDSVSGKATAAFALTINSLPVITTTSPLPGGTVGTYYSQGVTVSGGTAPYYWALGSGALPPGLSLDSASCPPIQTAGKLQPGLGRGAGKRTRLLNAGSRVKPAQDGVCLIVGTPEASGTANFTLVALDSDSEETAPAQFTLTIAAPAPITITTTSPLPSGDVGTLYSQTFAATGGVPPYNWSVSAGNLPAGLSLNSGTGQLTGTPTTPAPPTTLPYTSNFTVQAADSYGDSATATFALTINPAPAITTSSPLPGGIVGAYYSQEVTVSGGTAPFYWGVTAGALPPGLSLDSASCPAIPHALVQPGPGQSAARRTRLLNSGARVKPHQAPPANVCLIDGTPTTAGTSNFTMTVQDSAGLTASAPFSLTVSLPLPPTITTTSPLPSGDVGALYSLTFAASGGTGGYSWSLVAGTLPGGLSLTSGGAIVGTPTAAGTSNFSVQVVDSAGDVATAPFTLTINPAPAITTTSPLPGGDVAAYYSQGVTVSGGTAPFYWELTAGALPAGLSLDSSCLELSNKTATLPGAAKRSQPLNPGARVKPHQAPPAGSCLIDGTPTTPGPSNFTMQVQDSYGETATAQFSLTIDPLPAITTTSPLPSATMGADYSQGVTVSGGTAPFYWAVSAGSLPAGLSLDSASCPSIPSGGILQPGASQGAVRRTRVLNSGARVKPNQAPPANVCLIVGTPTTAETSDFTMQVQDSYGETASAQFALTVNPPPTITTSSPLKAGTVGVAYAQTVVATGGTPPLLWTVTIGTLPAGLALNSANGQISGTPTTAGTSNFTLQVTDVNLVTASKPFALTINSAPVITTTSPLPAGTVGANYLQTLAVSGGTLPFTWTVTTGALPPGLTLNSTGQISGTPTTAITSNFTIQAKDFNGATATQSFSLTINPPLTILPPPPPQPCTVGVFCSATLGVISGGTPPYVWTATGLPAGLVLNSATGQISGTPTTAGIFITLFRVTDHNAETVSKSFTFTVNPAPAITTKSLPPGTVGASYSQTVTAAGGTPPLVWAVLSPGALPAGLSLNTSNGQINGTPTTAGTSSFSIQVTDFNGATATASFTLTVNSPPAITTTSPLLLGTVGGVYSQALAVSGGTSPYIWTVTTGTLPAGLALNSTGQITGTPTAAGTSNVTIQVKDVNGATASKPFALTVNPAPVITTNSALPTGTVGVSYLQALTVTGGSGQYTWTVSVGALPAGLVLNSATGQISGTPTASGPSSFTIQVTDSNQVKATKAFTVTINAALSIITYSPLPPGMVGAVYSVPMIATGGTLPYTWTISGGTLPAGLSLNSVQGRISGTPTTASAATFSIQVSDSQGLTAVKSFSLSITGVLVITTSSALPAGTVSANYSQTVQATGGAAPYMWALIGGSLPAGLSLNSATGAISGTPTASGHANFTIRITDANQATTTAAFALTVNPLPVITNPPLPNPIVGASYSQTVSVSGGTGPYTFTVTKGALPPGLSLNSTTGQISGIPTAGGPASFTITVTDSNGVIGSQSFSLTTARLTITTTSPLLAGTADASYPALTLQATGGTLPYTWAVSAGALPAGLSLNSTTGKISGTPKAGGVANFTIQVTDANGVIASAPFTLTIIASSTVIPQLPSPVLGSFYSTQLLPPVPGAAFTWSVSTGSSLPPGLQLSPGGLISGTPVALGSFTFTVQATDASNNTTATTYSLTVEQAPFTLTIQAPPGTPLPQQQIPITVTLAQAYPVDLTGELVLQFTPNLAAPVVDPAIQFSTGGDSVSFTIPKGQTSAVFSQSPLLVQTGTVAGAIVFTASLTADNVPLTPTTAVTLNLAQEPPVITSVTIQQVTSGFNVVVMGYSNTREITQAAFTFAAQPGSQIQSTTFTPADVGTTFQTWYASSASIAYGGQFLYTQPFTITSGTVSALQSVTVTLTNSQGASSSMTATF